MKKISKILLGLGILLSNLSFADDIMFISPQPAEMINKTLKIQINPPMEPVPVHVYIESKMKKGAPIWTGVLDSKNKYTVDVDVSSFDIGLHEITADYLIGGQNFDGDIDFWVDTDIDPKGQYS